MVTSEKGSTLTTRELRRTPADAPPVVSGPGLMRAALPAVYHTRDEYASVAPSSNPEQQNLGLRFVLALETVLDPIVAVLDSLDHHIDPDLAPRHLLELLAAWLGIELDESWPDERRRDLIRNAGELHRRRGTRAGLELALRISFPHLPLRTEDPGGVVWSRDPAPDIEPASSQPELIVYCDVGLTEPEPALLVRVIEQLTPAHVPFRLRIKTTGSGGSP
jgi:phage tail-like protein